MKRRLVLVVTFVLLLVVWFIGAEETSRSPNVCKRVFNIKSFGAVGDGDTLDTKSVQLAIDTCAANSGGIVEVPAGSYRIGTIRMRSNVSLKLDDGATLLGSKSLADYATDILGLAEEPAFQKCLIHAENATNFGFQGAGIIDGSGSHWAFPVKVNGIVAERPSMLRLTNCKQVSFTGLTFKNPTSWGLHLVACQKVHFDGITIQSRDNNANNDGIDLDGCCEVLVENCRINSGDDAVCLKSTLPQPCSNIVVRSCQLSSQTACFKMGTSSRSGFMEVQVLDSRLHDCPMGAVKLLLVDGGRLENVRLERLTMEDVGGPIFIRLGNRGRLYDHPIEQVYKPETSPEGGPLGTLRNVIIKDVTARVTGKDLSRQGIMITGIPGHRIQGVTLENICVHFPGGGKAEDATRLVPEDIARYPEQFFFGVLPSWGIFLRHAEGITLSHVKIDCENGDARPPVYVEDVRNLKAKELVINALTLDLEKQMLESRANIFHEAARDTVPTC